MGDILIDEESTIEGHIENTDIEDLEAVTILALKYEGRDDIPSFWRFNADADGNWKIRGVPVGGLRITVSAPGFQQVVYPNLRDATVSTELEPYEGQEIPHPPR